VAKLVRRGGLKIRYPKRAYGFESRPRYQGNLKTALSRLASVGRPIGVRACSAKSLA
jgi:hypothetical protein